jgi:hypothetical protein
MLETIDEGIRQRAAARAAAFEDLVAKQVGENREKSWKFISVFETHTALMVELQKYWGEVRLPPGERNYGLMLGALVQLSATAQKCAEDVVIILIPPKK